MRPGLAMSQDGLNWARIEGEHHTGALLDVGEEGEWDELFIANPQASTSAVCILLFVCRLPFCSALLEGASCPCNAQHPELACFCFVAFPEHTCMNKVLNSLVTSKALHALLLQEQCKSQMA